jgi:hypothetical protein
VAVAMAVGTALLRLDSRKSRQWGWRGPLQRTHHGDDSVPPAAATQTRCHKHNTQHHPTAVD